MEARMLSFDALDLKVANSSVIHGFSCMMCLIILSSLVSTHELIGTP